jgi:hypothetical protein
MLITLLVSEFLVSKVLQDWVIARQDSATEDSVIWTMMHSGDLPYLSPADVEGSKQDLGRNRR